MATVYYLVEGDGGAKERVDHVRVVVKLLVHHEGQNTHLGGTAVGELYGLAAVLGNVGVGRAAVLLELVLDGGEAKLNSTDSEEGDGQTSGGKGVEHGKAGLHLIGAEGHASTSGGDQVAKDGEHGDAAMLDFREAKLIEAFLVRVRDELG